MNLVITPSVSVSQEYLYGQATKSLSYNDFVNKELVMFSNSDNERSLPCLIDGQWWIRSYFKLSLNSTCERG